MRHTLKTDSDVFKAVVAGLKTFEIRKDDRGFQVGDILELAQTRYTGAEMAAGKPLEYTGFVTTVGISHILRGPIYGLQDGWVIMSIRPAVERWQLVPKEPTRAMLDAGHCDLTLEHGIDPMLNYAWSQMLDAAPTPNLEVSGRGETMPDVTDDRNPRSA